MSEEHHCPIVGERTFCQSELPCDVNFVNNEFQKSVQTPSSLNQNHLLLMSGLFNIVLLVILALVLYNRVRIREIVEETPPIILAEEHELLEIKSDNST